MSKLFPVVRDYLRAAKRANECKTYDARRRWARKRDLLLFIMDAEANRQLWEHVTRRELTKVQVARNCGH